ncbi:hypothetical protein RB598_000551 [Gaeumannomyces tritici]
MTGDIPEMELRWRQTSPGVYQRRQDVRERMILLQEAKTPPGTDMVNECICIHAKLLLDSRHFPDAALALRQAWIALHHDHPSMAMTAVGESMVYRAVDCRSVEAWADETFTVHDSGTALDWYTKLPGTRRVLLEYFPHTNEVLLRGSHAILDGIGASTLVGNFCRRLNHPPEGELQWGNHVKNLSPPLELAVNLPDPTDASIKQARSKLEAWEAKATRTTPLVLFPDRSLPALSPAVMIRRFSVGETAQMARAAKQHGVSMRDLTHAAIVCAIKLHSASAHGTWLGGLALNVRPLCRPPFGSPAHAATAYFVSMLACVEDPQDVWDAAFQLRAQNQALLGESDLGFVKPMAALLSPQRDPERNAARGGGEGAAAAGPGGAAGGPVMYGGVGVLDSVLAATAGFEDSSVRVEDVWFALHKCSAAMIVSCHALRGRMTYSLSYNAAFYSQARMAAFLDVAASLLPTSRFGI